MKEITLTSAPTMEAQAKDVLMPAPVVVHLRAVSRRSSQPTADGGPLAPGETTPDAFYTVSHRFQKHQISVSHWAGYVVLTLYVSASGAEGGISCSWHCVLQNILVLLDLLVLPQT